MGASLWNPADPAGSAASLVPFEPTATIAAENVQDAIEEVDTEWRTFAELVSNPNSGDINLAVKRTFTNAQSTTQHVINEYRRVIATIDGNVPNDGVTSATAAIQTLFNECASNGNVSEIFFPSGTYLLTNPNNDSQATCAVVISGLKRCKIYGGKNTKFIVNATGTGSSEFGMFRLEQCEDLEFCWFEMDGSGITITGAGANRSFSFVINNFNVNSPATDLPVNKRLVFHDLYIHDIGGGPSVLPRSASLAAAPTLDLLMVYNCEMKNLLNVNHGVAACFVDNLYVCNNKFWNNIPSVTPIDNMAVDASRGTTVAYIKNNKVYGFCYGIKCETQTNAGPSGTEMRPSKRVVIENNLLEEIGDPTNLVVGGDNTFGIKANGIDTVIRGNTVRKRTINLTTGGLYVGIIAVNTHNDDSSVVVKDNKVYGPSYGIIHNDTTVTTRECSAIIKDNRLVDCTVYAASIQGNCDFDDNIIIRAGTSGVEIQTSNMTFVRRNKFVDCANVDNPIIPERVAAVYQSTVGAIGGYTEIKDNIVVDSRGGSAAEYAYFLRAAPTLTNPMVFVPGYVSGMLTAVSYDTNFNVVGDTPMVGGVNRPGPREFLVTNNPQTTAPWSTLSWNVGDTGKLYPPIAGAAKGWICTVAGTPGTWVSLGNL